MDNDRVFADYIKGTTICAVKKTAGLPSPETDR